MRENAHFAAIEEARAKLGDRLVILAHHYMNDAVARHADHTGDSLELSRLVPGLDAEYIVFCGVFFMAETAAVLTKPGQKVFIPERHSSCVMSDMAPAWLLPRVLDRLDQAGIPALPLTYVNSSAGVKALVGERGGSVCTSANAKIMLAWAMNNAERTLFLPDMRLGSNACDWLDVPRKDRHILNIKKHGAALNTVKAKQAKVLLWPGQCVIHSRFKAEQIAQARRSAPGCLVVVHPECHPSVAAQADACGSTSLIIKFVAEAPKGSVIYIGTEFNLVARLAHQYRGEKEIHPLYPSTCANMAKITEEKLAATLADLDSQTTVEVDDRVRDGARLALERMLEACGR